MAGLINNWLSAAEQNAANHPQTDWLHDKRQQARAQLEHLQDPTRKLEYWRYADAGRLTAELPSTGELKQPGESESWVITINEQGFELSANWPDHLQVTSIMGIDPGQWHEVVFDQETAANLSNTLLFNQGVQLTAGQAKAEKAGQVVMVYDFAEPQKWHFVRNQFKLPVNSRITVLEQLMSGRVNVVNVFALGTAAQLNRQQYIHLNAEGAFVGYTSFELADAAEVSSMNWHQGGSLQHHIQQVNFNDSGSKFKSGSINKSFDNNNITDIVNVNHHKKNNQSEVTHRSMAQDKSQIFSNAKAYVAPGADQSEIEQDLKNILLSEDAKIFSKPELEVYADEVIAAHGSTIGALDDQALFYLQSRGIPLAEARDMMIVSFEQEAVIC